MKVPITWLKDYVDIEVSPKELGDKLTLSGSNVDEIIIEGEDIESVVTGKILKIEPHPDSDHLVICQVDVKKEVVQIVTGADNMKEGDTVPVALHGASLPKGVKIKKGKLRGIPSNGMMCSASELGIPDENAEDGLMILKEDTPIGKDIKDVLGLQSAVIDFEITSNRPDCLSIIGMARETAATLNTKYKMPNLSFSENASENIDEYIKVKLEDDLCKRYMARAIKDVKIEDSPKWMQERLLEAGVRPINNIVDITNFVMIELGQPMHAFDRREIKSGEIVIKRASNDAEFTTLDDVKRTLNSDILTINDGETPIALAGIMGGLDSEIKEDTNFVIFESANFDARNIRVNSKKLGIRTEASNRYEKGLDENICEIAMNRALNLVEELGAGKILKGAIDIYKNKVEPHKLAVEAEYINRFLGTSMTNKEMAEYLNRLELNTIIECEDLIITVPTFRGDVNIKEDVAEEIGRIFGYDNIPKTIFKGSSIHGGKNREQKLGDMLVDALISCGLSQSISYSFVSPKVFDKINLKWDSIKRDAIKIKNPLGEDFSIMRTTTLPSMMEALSRNYSRNNDFARLFEIGKVYLKKDGKELPEEKNVVTIGLYGNVDYVDLKGIVENILETFAINNGTFERNSEDPSFHPGKTADLLIKKDYVGIFGEIHPDVSENYGLETRCFVAELDLDVLFKWADLNKKYKPLPKYPAVTRDLAVLVEDSVLCSDILGIINKQGGNLVEKVNLFDVYKGEQIPSGKKSMAFSIIYRVSDRTLTDVEVNKVHDKIVRSLEYGIGAELR